MSVRDDLIRDLSEAFPLAKFPDHLGEVPVPEEFTGHDWKTLPLILVLQNSDVFLFSDSALQYFLPGYLLVMLRHPENMVESFLVRNVLRELGQQYSDGKWRDICGMFTKEQGDLIRRFLGAFSDIFFNDVLVDEHIASIERRNPGRLMAINATVKKQVEKHKKLLNGAIEYWENCKHI